MASVTLSIRMPTITAVPGAGLTARIRDRFLYEGGQLVLDSIRKHLGVDSLYTLSPEYAARKPKLPGYRRFSGKDPDQPIILTGAIYDNLTVVPTGDGFYVYVKDGHAISPQGFDYAELWQTRTAYLYQGIADVEDKLADLLLDITFDEMML